MANSTAALRKELALTVTDPFALLAEALQRNDELRDRCQLLEHALTQAQKKAAPQQPSLNVEPEQDISNP